MPSVHLAAFDQSHDLPLLATWLRMPHVARWWGDPEQALDAIGQHPVDTAALIEVGALRVGFVCWQIPLREELAMAGLSDLPNDLVDIDIFIGELDFLGKGVGPAALHQLLARLQAEGVRVVGLGVATANIRALRAYHKAGFQPFRDFEENGQRMRYLVQTVGAATG